MLAEGQNPVAHGASLKRKSFCRVERPVLRCLANGAPSVAKISFSSRISRLRRVTSPRLTLPPMSVPRSQFLTVTSLTLYLRAASVTEMPSLRIAERTFAFVSCEPHVFPRPGLQTIIVNRPYCRCAHHIWHAPVCQPIPQPTAPLMRIYAHEITAKPILATRAMVTCRTLRSVAHMLRCTVDC